MIAKRGAVKEEQIFLNWLGSLRIFLVQMVCQMRTGKRINWEIGCPIYPIIGIKIIVNDNPSMLKTKFVIVFILILPIDIVAKTWKTSKDQRIPKTQNMERDNEAWFEKSWSTSKVNNIGPEIDNPQKIKKLTNDINHLILSSILAIISKLNSFWFDKKGKIR